MLSEIIVVGTAHVSKKSIEEVERIIEEKKPDAVAVELDFRRFEALIGKKQDINLVEVIRKGNIFLFLFQLILSNLQKKMGKETGVNPGEEMLRAIWKAKEIGANVLLIDRDIGITMKRLWNELSFFEKLKLIYDLLKGKEEEFEIDEILEKNLTDLFIEEFRKISPKAAKILIDERDLYMALSLLNASKKYNKIVAVVGAGHKEGIERFLRDPPEIDIRQLVEVKERKIGVLKIIGSLITAFTILLLISILIKLGTSEFLSAFIFWFLINGILSSAFAALAGGHILSILTAFFVAWLTSLSPLLAAGWFSGIVEFFMRKPTQEDIERLTGAESLREMYKNKAFKVLLVAALTNLGSGLGTLIGLWYLSTHYGINIKDLILDFLSFNPIWIKTFLSE